MSTPIRPSQISAPGSPPYSMAPARGTGAPYPPPYPPQSSSGVKSMERLKQELGGVVLNASRVSVEPGKLYGLQDGQPITPIVHHRLPHTGVKALDHRLGQAATTAGDVVEFTPQAISNTASEVFRGSVLGGIGSFLLSAVGTAITTAVKKEFTSGNAAATTLLLTLLGSFIGGGVGFAQSAVENLRDLKRLVLGSRP